MYLSIMTDAIKNIGSGGLTIKYIVISNNKFTPSQINNGMVIVALYGDINSDKLIGYSKETSVYGYNGVINVSTYGTSYSGPYTIIYAY